MFHGNSSMKNRMYIDEQAYYEQMAEIKDSTARLSEYHRSLRVATDCGKADKLAQKSWESGLSIKRPDRYYVPAGQSTQMIVGATGESDYQIISVAEAMYNRFDMKRVFYSAFVNVNMDESLPGIGQPPPLKREHRLYQADWLLRYYHFEAGELLDEENPNFNAYLDPKCFWALRHLEEFPIEINYAAYDMLLRVPGIGYKSASRIVKARRMGMLDFEDLKKMGVVLKRALYFITCKGKMMYPIRMDEDYITRNLLNTKEKLPEGADGMSFRQLSLFDDMGIE